ncbi:MAG: amidohydrolase [Acidobacteriota bacterium]
MKAFFPTLLVALLATSMVAIPALATTDPVAAWNTTQPDQPAIVLVQNATIWTSAEAGNLENADLLIRAGKITEIGTDLTAPADAVVIDASGKHVTAGLIDAHSHSAIIGGVNEATNISTAEVRIGDVVNGESVQIYRQLAGGVTAISLLHGSANSIGGQNHVIKMRWGATPEELTFTDAPEGIKFALGENPKQSNWGLPDELMRYPQTRQGVEQSIRERFQAAVDYRDAWAEWRAKSQAGERLAPPRKDLNLDAMVEIMDGTRLVHSHSYRGDEILMLIRLAEEFGFTVATFQHVLEGYKVADELAAHGAGASAFSDWWAFKYEVRDAIPWAGAIMWDRDVLVSFNSDSSELARRMNLEAAKAVRYGGVPEAEALKFVTLNPAIQLGIDTWVGSLEVGKDADFVIWNGHPLSTLSRADQTWVDGRKYFDRERDLVLREEIIAERTALLDKVRAASESEDGEDSGPPTELETPSWLVWQDAHDEYCFAHDHDHGHGHDEHAHHHTTGEDH